MPGSTYKQLAEVASERYGFVTPSDARDLGVNPMNLVRLAERGQIERRGTGLYRFPLVPANQLDGYMEATLWPQRARGVISHETALELYGLSDVHPAKIHVTVPSHHRVRRPIPPSYRLHQENLRPDELSVYEGIPIVTPEHAIRQADRTNLGAALIGQAIDHGEQNGRLTTGQARKLRRELGVHAGDGTRR